MPKEAAVKPYSIIPQGPVVNRFKYDFQEVIYVGVVTGRSLYSSELLSETVCWRAWKQNEAPKELPSLF